MTGWRIGWMLVPDRLRRACDVLTGNFTICPPVLAQRACLAAFDDATYAELDGHVAALRRQPRDCCSTGCPRLGITELAPADGAFYVYADVGHLTEDTMAFCHDLLARTGVAMAPGHRLRHRGRPPVRPDQLPGPGGRHRGGAGRGSPQSSDSRFRPQPAAGRPPACTATPRRSAGWPAPCAARARRCAPRPTALLARAEARPGRGWPPTRCGPGCAPRSRRCAAPPSWPTTPPARSSGTPTRWTGSRP